MKNQVSPTEPQFDKSSPYEGTRRDTLEEEALGSGLRRGDKDKVKDPYGCLICFGILGPFMIIAAGVIMKTVCFKLL